MPRRKKTRRKEVNVDARYKDNEVATFISLLMWDGKKNLACSMFYKSLEIIGKKTNEEPLAVFKKALNNVKPRVEVRARRVGGATYQIPVEVPSKRSLALAVRWMIKSARARKGKDMAERLVDEFLESAKGEGPSVKKREDTHKMAESNRAFAHYRW